MQLATIITALEKIAPLGGAEEWDNVGLLAGDPAQDIAAILLTIDYSPAVAEEARAQKCDLVIAYHPPIFSPLKRVVAGSAIFDAIRGNVAIYSPHTALDVADGGTNDMLADAIGLSDREPLAQAAQRMTQYKLVTFVPIEAVEKVSAALFDAGAGRIGNYTSCSFRAAGTGTFFGEAGTNPKVGSSGRLEKVDEIRLETVVPAENIEHVIRALRSNHPYEEPAFDLNVLAVPATGKGQGRIGTMAKISRQEVFARMKRELGLEHLLIAGPTTGMITRAAVCAGSCGKFLPDAIAGKAELFLTGELRHHDALAAAAAGMTVVCTLHSNSERAVLKRVADRLGETAGMPKVSISRADRDPFAIL
jgi:dinuclear metal center YbgI/SA1388 family protein